MKKFFAFVCMVFFATSAFAQLNVKSSTKDAPEKVMTLQVAYSEVYHVDGTYIIRLNTSNRFDKSTYVVLGDDVSSATQTTQDLINLITNKIASTSVEQGGVSLTFLYQNNLGVEQLYIKQKGNAGFSYITLKSLEKLLDYFKSL